MLRFSVLIGLGMALVPCTSNAWEQEKVKDEVEWFQLPSTPEDALDNVVLVSTIEGKLIALDAAKNGQVMWQITGDPLFSGTLSKMEPMLVNGMPVGLFPSLDGDLYVYVPDIHVMELIPVNTDYLLDATLKLGQDAVAGGRTISTIGVDPFTGQIRYRCTMDQCSTMNNSFSSTTLVVKKVTKSVRAVDALKGSERWNLSVTEIELSLAGKTTAVATDYERHRLLLRPPDGMITAVDEFDQEVWTSCVGNHIVRVWHLVGGVLREVSIFDSGNLYTSTNSPSARTDVALPDSLFYLGTTNGDAFIIQSPRLKQDNKRRARNFGDFDILSHMSRSEVYSPRITGSNQIVRNTEAFQFQQDSMGAILQSLFQRTYASRMAIADSSATSGTNSPTTRDLRVVTHNYADAREGACPNPTTTGVAIISIRDMSTSAEAADGDNGWLIVAPPAMPSPRRRSLLRLQQQTSSFLAAGMGNFGWKLGCVIAAAFATVSIFVRTALATQVPCKTVAIATPTSDKRRDNPEEEEEPITPVASKSKLEMALVVALEATPNGKNVSAEKKSERKIRISDAENEDDKKQKPRKICDGDSDPKLPAKPDRSRTVSRNSQGDFHSKFFAEFHAEKILGRGGFGVVFRARNILDNNVYGVKRIAVADNEVSIERVRREVRALAPIEHTNIIRYYHTWLEYPPPGWQDKADEELMAKIRPSKKKPKAIAKAEDSCLSSVGIKFDVPEAEKNKDDTWSIDWNEPESAEAKESSSSSDSDSSDDDDAPKKIEKSDCFESSGIVFQHDTNEVSGPQKIMQHGAMNSEMLVSFEDGSLLPTKKLGDRVYMYIVMQLCQEKTLHDWLITNKEPVKRSLPKMCNWILQLAEGLNYLHARSLIHRDLKPKNIFFANELTHDGKEHLKIGDLGLVTETSADLQGLRESFEGNTNHTDNVGTRSYMSPEQLNRMSYTEKVDIFSLGLISCELIVPFPTQMERVDVFLKFQYGRDQEALRRVPQDSNDFVGWLTKFNPDERPTAAEVINSDFIRSHK